MKLLPLGSNFSTAGSPAIKGIYLLKENQLQYCWGRPNQPRPTDFEFVEGSGRTLVQLERFSTGEAKIEEALREQGVYFTKDEIGWITKITVVEGQDSDAILELIAPLEKLEELGVGGVTKNGVAFLGSHKELQVLGLYGDTLVDSDLEFLRQTPQLWSVSMGGSNLTDQSVQHLQSLKELSKLSFYQTKITIAGLKQLPAPLKIRSLRFPQRQITDSELQAMVQIFPNINSIWLSGSGLTDTGLSALADLSQLSFVRLPGTQISDDGIKHLSASTRINRLDLSDSDITGAGFSHLKGMDRLEFLIVKNTKITDNGLAVIADSFPALRNLDARSVNGLTIDGVQKLSKLQHLNTLSVSKGTFSPEQIESLEGFSPSEFRVIQQD